MKSALELYAEQVFPPTRNDFRPEAIQYSQQHFPKNKAEFAAMLADFAGHMAGCDLFADLNADTRRRFVEAVERLLRIGWALLPQGERWEA